MVSLIRFLRRQSAKILSTICGCWFHFTQKYLPRPLRMPIYGEVSWIRSKHNETDRPEPFLSMIRRLRSERAIFKNVSICLGRDIPSETTPKSHDRISDPRQTSNSKPTHEDLLAARIEKAVLAKPDTVDKIIGHISTETGLDPDTVLNGLGDLEALGIDSLLWMEVIFLVEDLLGIDSIVFENMGDDWSALERALKSVRANEREMATRVLDSEKAT